MQSVFKIYTAEELLRRASEAPPFLVPGLVHSTITLLTGVPKCGKSRVAAALAVAALDGSTFLGSRFTKVIDRVTIIATDPGGDLEYGRRLKDAGLDPGQPLRAVPLPGPPDWGLLCEQLSPQDGDLVILDTLTGATGGELIDGPAVVGALSGMASMAAQGATVVIVHHESTSPGLNGGRSRRPMGHTAIEGMARWVVRVSKGTSDTKLHCYGNDAEEQDLVIAEGLGVLDFTVQSLQTADDLREVRATRKRERERGDSGRLAEAADQLIAEVPTGTAAEMARTAAERFSWIAPTAQDRPRTIQQQLSKGSGLGGFLERGTDGSWTRRGQVHAAA